MSSTVRATATVPTPSSSPSTAGSRSSSATTRSRTSTPTSASRSATRPPAASERSALQGSLEGGELGLGLREFGDRVRPGDDPAPGEQPGPVLAGQLRAPQREAELAVTASDQPAHRAGVAPAVHALELRQEG